MTPFAGIPGTDTELSGKLRSISRAGTGTALDAAKARAETQGIFTNGRSRDLDKRRNMILNRHVRSCFRIRWLSLVCPEFKSIFGIRRDCAAMASTFEKPRLKEKNTDPSDQWLPHGNDSVTLRHPFRGDVSPLKQTASALRIRDRTVTPLKPPSS